LCKILNFLSLTQDKIYNYQDYFGQDNIPIGYGHYKADRVIDPQNMLKTIREHKDLIEKIYEYCGGLGLKTPAVEEFRNYYTNL
jgi:hypothetical protein